LDKGREYVRKQQQAEIKSRLSKDMMAYEAIRASNIRATKAASLLGGPPLLAPVMPSMIEMEDGRMMSGELKLALSSKKIITTTASTMTGCVLDALFTGAAWHCTQEVRQAQVPHRLLC
jgi:hypothetical protein